MVLLCPSCVVPKRPCMAVAPGFKSSCQSSSAVPFPTPPTIGHSCQHSHIFPAVLGCCSNSKSGQVWPCSVEPIISKLFRRLYNQGELPPSYIMGGSHSHPPGSKHGHSCLTYLWNQLKVIDMLNDHSRGYLQNCCYSKQLSMALLHSSHPPAQTCGGEDILYIFFLIFPGHPEFWTPLQIPIWGPPWLHPVTVSGVPFHKVPLYTCLFPVSMREMRTWSFLVYRLADDVTPAFWVT